MARRQAVYFNTLQQNMRSQRQRQAALLAQLQPAAALAGVEVLVADLEAENDPGAAFVARLRQIPAKERHQIGVNIAGVAAALAWFIHETSIWSLVPLLVSLLALYYAVNDFLNE